MLNRVDSPGYPTMRRFRQLAPGVWNTVIDKVGEELRLRIQKDEIASALRAS